MLTLIHLVVLRGLAPQIFAGNFRPKGGYVPDVATAVAIGRAVLAPVFGKEQIRKEEPLLGALKANVWIVRGSAPKLLPGQAFLGGLAEVHISKKTGAIMTMWHDK